MCDPKSHHRCINKGILWRNNKNSGVIPPDSFVLSFRFDNKAPSLVFFD